MTTASRRPRGAPILIDGASLPSLLLALAVARHGRTVRWNPAGRTEPTSPTPLVLTPRLAPRTPPLPPAVRRAVAGHAARQLDAFTVWMARLLDLPPDALPMRRLPWRLADDHAMPPMTDAAAILDGGWVWQRALDRLDATPAIVPVRADADAIPHPRLLRITVVAPPWDGGGDAPDVPPALRAAATTAVLTLPRRSRGTWQTLFPWDSRILAAPTVPALLAADGPRAMR